MGCWTAYVLRAEDGSCWTMGEKWGDWCLAKESDRIRIVESILRGGVAVDDDSARGLVDSWFCRGVVLDLVTHRYRFFGCDLQTLQPGVSYLESTAVRVASAPGWSGWDVGYAWSGREGLVEVVSEARPAEDTVHAGAVIDLPSRRLRYWTTESVPPQLVAKVAAAWPGWTVERLPLGFIGHLAATGRDGEDLFMTNAELRDGGWEEDLIDIRNGERIALTIDPRTLRPPGVRVIDEA